MRQDRRFQKKKGLTAEQKRLIPLAGIVIALILLILIVFTVGQKNNASVSQSASEGSLAAEEGSPQENAPETAENEGSGNPEVENSVWETSDEESDLEVETDAPVSLLQKNSIPEILSVMEQYFTARANADADTINALYGVSGASDDSLVAHRDQLLPAAKYISSFDDVATYVMDGIADNNWLVYTTTDIRFFAATAKAPMIMWCFIEKGDDDSYYILDNRLLSQEMLDCADIANHSDEVRALASEINNRLRTALEEDADLDEVYGILRAGSPLWEDEEDTEAEVVILDDSESVAEDSADAESEPLEENTENEHDDGDDAPVESDSQPETDTDTEADTEMETDADTGSSAETEAGTDTDTEASDDADTGGESSAEAQ